MAKSRNRKKRSSRGIHADNAEKNNKNNPKGHHIASDSYLSSGSGDPQSDFGPATTGPATGFNIKGAARELAPPWPSDYVQREKPYQNSKPDLIDVNSIPIGRPHQSSRPDFKDVNSIPIGRDRGFFTTQKEDKQKGHATPEPMAPHHPRGGRNGPTPGRREQPFSRPKRDGPQKKEHPRRQYPLPRASTNEDLKVVVDPVPDFDVHAVGPHPGVIEPCRRYVFESRIQKCLKTLGTESKDEAWKIQGVTFIDQMRKSLELPTKTFNTAATIFHRFRLQYSLDTYPLTDTTAAALYLASKIEDTAKKPSQIVCAGYNISQGDSRQPEDDHFDGFSDRVVDLESLMLEGISFEFDTRHPQQLVAKILQVEFNYDFSNEKHRLIFRAAWAISMDLNYTFALLKQTTGTLAIACVELTLRLLGHLKALDKMFPEDVDNPYHRFASTRLQVTETIMDLLDLYTTNRSLTFAGTQFSREDIVDVRILLNKVMERYKLPRYAHWRDEESGLFGTPAYVTSLKAPKDISVASTSPQTEGRGSNNDQSKSNGEASSKSASHPVRRFILQPGEAVREVADLDDYFVMAEEEYDKEHEIDDGWATASDEDGDVPMKNVQRTPPTGPGKNRRR